MLRYWVIYFVSMNKFYGCSNSEIMVTLDMYTVEKWEDYDLLLAKYL